MLGITDEDIISLKEENILNTQATKKLNLSIGMDNPKNFPLGFSNVNYTNSTFTVNSSNNESIWKMESPRSSANSPLTPMSPSYAKMFLPSPTTGNNLVTNTLENLQIPSMAFNYNATYISRILTATCKDLKKLIYLIQLYIDPLNIIGARQVSIGKTQFLVIGWFDLRNISSNVSTLKLIANNEGLNDLEFDYIKNDLTFNHVTNTHNFRFLEDVYDTIYIAVDNKLPNLNINQFQNDLYFQLIKNGAVNSMKQIDSIVGCFKVRFYDIRVTFELQKMSYIKVGSLRANIYSTLVDLFESILKKNCLEQSLSNDLKLNPQQSGLPALNESEWKKYMQLKHRRLASLPFSMCSVPQENKIDISKIKSNEEKRATLMIRNIPNKVTHNELKEYIDVTSWGDYEFLCVCH